ncbi:MAG TPA: NAD-dependent epimerase/dehydratase family protein [Burkholderiaceae bacterium]|nr:NAD-dependent epimerase/dehydratase family protein [Burkholderiaceae bacterium]
MEPCATRLLRRPRLLIVGCGDVGLRVLRLLHGRWRVLAVTSSPPRRGLLRAAGATPLVADLDDAASLARLARLADAVLHLAPPAPHGEHDRRTAALLAALARGGGVRRLVYASTSGVYGDCAGARVHETRALNPCTDRACRRADAESRVRGYARACGVRATILRVPGIYAFDRAGGDPRERVRRGASALVEVDDVFTNHIHADDLARACAAALLRGPTMRAIHVTDDDALKMGDYLDRVADRCGLTRVPRLTLEQAQERLTPLQMSFLGESRRLDNTRMKRELRVALRYPTIEAALASVSQAGPADVGRPGGATRLASA